VTATLLVQSRCNRISLTPLIDVVFILLMFFMLTSSFTREKQLQLVSPVVAEAATVQEPPRRLLLRADGSLADLQDPAVVLSNQTLDLWIKGARPLVLQPLEEADVQAIVSAMTRLRALGARRLSLGNVYPGG